MLHESLDAVQCIHDQCTGYTIPDAALIAVHPFSEVLFESTYHAIGANLNRWDWRISLDCDSWFVHRVSLSCVVACESVLYSYYRHSATLAASYSVKNSKVSQHFPKSFGSKRLRLAGRAGFDLSPYRDWT